MTLNAIERHIARLEARNAAMLGVKHAPAIHYTQSSPARWQGIDEHKIASKGQYPTEADCSAFATWCLAQGLHFRYKQPDTVNGLDWTGGWTGTLAAHGRHVEHLDRTLTGDLVLYGSPPDFEHVAIVVHPNKGRPIIVSHGSENGPLLLPYNYRPDVGDVRRYI